MWQLWVFLSVCRRARFLDALQMGFGWTASSPRTPCFLFSLWTLLLFCSHAGIFMLIVLALLSFSLLLRDTWTQSAAR